ncbi:MAG: glycoside hydrolase/phage tail family protein [Pseudomonadota bacterium]
MATIVLQTVGAAVGGSLGGPLGAVIGQTLGAAGGAYIDQRLFGPGDKTVEGPRLESTQFLSSQEGAVIPQVFGTARIAGEIIWATRLREVLQTEKRSQGGKGGASASTTVKTYSYYGNFAIGICEGPIGGIRRIWADGREIEKPSITFRIYNGDEDQLPDSLIEAKQGADNAPAYRGLAYAVFEEFPLEDYGNRIPQISCEVLRPTGEVEKCIRAFNLIPGATEFGYDTEPVVERSNAVESPRLNINQNLAETDFLASLDELLALCPNLEQVTLIAAWFGDDLRAGSCKIRPKVETNSRKLRRGQDWSVGGLPRAQAHVVSSVEGQLAFGGTPSDGSLRRAIAEIKSRGLRVGLNPFLMMDIPPDNTLPSPYGGIEQPAYPWRGRITCDPAIGQENSVDQSAIAGEQIAAFLGTVSPSQMAAANFLSTTLGQTEWSYRRMIFHYANLAQSVGGVDFFVIGSEMKFLTRVRNHLGAFPFVDGLKEIAAQAKAALGDDCIVTYAADWSEYFGYQPQDGSGDVFFNLDSLWSAPAIDAVAIDNYMPISDWRGTEQSLAEGRSATDPDMLFSQINSGEGYDWYYASSEDRESGVRTPITDGLGKPWVYRYKDIYSWWENPHFERNGGTEAQTQTGWVPRSKPIIFAEYGCPAVDNGCLQPNVFSDPKSAENSLPYFSNGGRSDEVQAAYFAAHHRFWGHDNAAEATPLNPQSDLYDGRMVDVSRSQAWAWDARPYPAFPLTSKLWADKDNWFTGHWMNGRLGRARIADVIASLLLRSGIEDFDVKHVEGMVTGVILGQSSSARGALEALLNTYRISVQEVSGTLIFRSQGLNNAVRLTSDDLVEVDDTPILIEELSDPQDLPDHVRLSHIDPAVGYQPTETLARLVAGQNMRQAVLNLPVVNEPEILQPVAEQWILANHSARRSLNVRLPLNYADLQPGDVISLSDAANSERWSITSLVEGNHIEVSAVGIESRPSRPVRVSANKTAFEPRQFDKAPLLHFLDLPNLGNNTNRPANRVAASVSPWPGEMAVFSSPGEDDFALRQILSAPATAGVLHSELPPGKAFSRWDRKSVIVLEAFGNNISSSNPIQVLNGVNALAVEKANGGWEVIQFSTARLIAPNLWELSNLLRGQAGTESEMQHVADAGSSVVFINDACVPLSGSDPEKGLLLNWQVGPAGAVIGDANFTSAAFAAGYRGDQTYRPVHAKVQYNPDGSVLINWIRRDRFGSDDWEQNEIPMSEESLLFRISIEDQIGNEIVREVASTSLLLTPIELENAFGNDPADLQVSVSQVSSRVGSGPTATISFQIS